MGGVLFLEEANLPKPSFDYGGICTFGFLFDELAGGIYWRIYCIFIDTGKLFSGIVPFLCLAWTSGKNHEMSRYPLLLRYRTRNEFFLIRFLAKAFFAMTVLLEHIGALLIMGHSLPIAPQILFVSSEHPAGIIIMQFFNLLCYVCVMILLYELLFHVTGNAMRGVMLTASVSLLNLLVVKLVLKTTVVWTPWGNVAYRLFGQERSGYRFYGMYWIFLLLFLFYLADEWNGRKDYVFEETRRAG